MQHGEPMPEEVQAKSEGPDEEQPTIRHHGEARQAWSCADYSPLTSQVPEVNPHSFEQMMVE